MSMRSNTVDNSDSAEFERRALAYLSTGKGEATEADWLAKEIRRNPELRTALARVWGEASNSAAGEQEVQKVLGRMKLITAKSIGVADLLKKGEKK